MPLAKILRTENENNYKNRTDFKIFTKIGLENETTVEPVVNYKAETFGDV